MSENSPSYKTLRVKKTVFRLHLNLNSMLKPATSFRGGALIELAHVLLVHGDLSSRLALQTILQAGGYSVDVAATPSEALAKLDEGEYELVLTDPELGPDQVGRQVLAYARVKHYRPATALITGTIPAPRHRPERHQVAIQIDDLSLLLGKVADLIGLRATRRHLRPAYRVAG
jgi:CheY-like chemotaxis protein